MGRPGNAARRAVSFFLGLPTTTPQGRIFLAGVVALGFLASATDRNFVLLVLGLLLAVVIVSVLAASANLGGIEFRRTIPEAVIAGEPFTVRVRLTSRRRWLPARGVLLKDALQSSLTGVESRCYAEQIPAGGQVTFVYNARIRRRGAYNITNALLTTRFPFGLFEKRALARHPTRIVVYPRMEDIADERLPGTREAHVVRAERAIRRPEGNEFRSLRDYRPGDDPRRIAWRVSARQGRLVLKETERENRGRVAVLLATSLEGVPLSERRSALERGIVLAASLARHFHRERRPLVFGAPGLTREVRSAGGLHGVLGHLATLRSDPAADASAVVRSVGPRRLRGMDVILVTPGPARVAAIPNGGYRLHHVSMLSRRATRLFRRQS